MIINTKLIVTGAIMAAIAVALGAFGAHKLKSMVSEQAVQTFETAARYMMYHAFAIVLCGMMSGKSQLFFTAGWLFIIGVILFSGSLILLTYKAASVSPGLSWVGPITPIGGLFFIAGWILFAVAAARIKMG